MALLNHLTLTDDQRVAVNRWKYAQRKVRDASGPLGKGFIPPEIDAEWNEAMQGMFSAGLNPDDYLRKRQQ